MVEMTVVVAIVGVLVTMAYWGFSGVVPRWRLSAAARDVATNLALARARAISQNRHHFVQFQVNSGTYQLIADTNGNDGTLDAADQVVQTWRCETGVTYFRPTDALPTNVDPAGDFVAFDPKGIAFNMTPDGRRVGLTNGSVPTREVLVRYSGLIKKF
jgi:Tfp pilus assembly protein FimT